MDIKNLTPTERGGIVLLLLLSGFLAWIGWIWLSGLFFGIAGGAIQLLAQK